MQVMVRLGKSVVMSYPLRPSMLPLPMMNAKLPMLQKPTEFWMKRVGRKVQMESDKRMVYEFSFFTRPQPIQSVREPSHLSKRCGGKLELKPNSEISVHRSFLVAMSEAPIPSRNFMQT